LEGEDVVFINHICRCTQKAYNGHFKTVCVFNILQSTLKHYVKNVDTFSVNVVEMKIGRKPVLPPAMETGLANYCLIMEERFFGLA
jgi:hypothetical protein